MSHPRTLRHDGFRHQLDATNLRLLAAIAAGFGLASACGGRADSPDTVGPASNQGQGARPTMDTPPQLPAVDPTPPAPAALLPPRAGEYCYHPSALADLGIPVQLEPAAFDESGCLAGTHSGWLGGGNCRHDPDGAVLREGGQCCYVLVDGPPTCGRPLIVDGRTRRVAAPSAQAPAPREPAATEATMLAIGREWLNDALLEHASIASFSLFGLSLMALGAPLQLVAECQQAVQDEVEHARACFRLAARYGAEHSSAGPLDLSGARISTDLAEITLRTLLDSCVEETIAAVTARAQLEVATDADVEQVLLRIADDELRHAELGWKFVAWALTAREPRILHALRDVRASLEALSPPAHADPPNPDLGRLHAAGRIAPNEQRLVRRQALSLVIRPALDTLIARAELYERHAPVVRGAISSAASA